MPIKNGQVPLVSTGAEYLVPQLASSKFIQRALQDGKVEEIVTDNYVKVKYKDGQTQYIDITPRLSSTKRASYLSLGMNTLKEGDSFKKNEAIAWTNTFSNGGYSCGRNLKMALMNYLGFSHEDGYCISEEVSELYSIESVEEVSIIVPTDTKVINMINTKKNTDPGEVLIEFGYVGDLDDYIDNFNILDNDSEESDSAVYNYFNNNIQLKSPGGEISDIRIYINNRNQTDPIILETWKKITTDLKKRQKLYSYGKTSQRDKISAIDNLDMAQLKTGSHKYKGILYEGTRIVFYIKKDKKLGHGDKCSNR